MTGDRLNLWPLLAPLSWGFAAGSAVRNALWDLGLRPVHRPHARIISVGGLMAGGSGKTPVTLDILLHLQQRFGVHHARRHPDEPTPIALVSRGYGRRTRGVQIVSDGTRVLLSARDGGDEPVMIARRMLAASRKAGDGRMIPSVPVIVAEDRLAGIRLAETRFRSRIVVLDDAFSHRRVARDLDILVLNEDLPRWWWRPLPAGRLREWPTAIERADHIVLHGGRVRDRVTLCGERLSAGRVSFTETQPLRPGHLKRMPERDGEAPEIVPWNSLPDKVFVASGIARPERFERAMAEMCTVLGTHRLPDHAPWTRQQRDDTLARARTARADAIVLTEKDAVKWPAQAPPVDIPVLVSELELRWYPRPSTSFDDVHTIPDQDGPAPVVLPRGLADAIAWVWHSAPRPR